MLCGRQGRRGLASLLITASQYEYSPFATVNEVQTNPLYTQIIKLVSSGLDPYAIFAELSFSKISKNIQFLVENECLNYGGSDVPNVDLSVTPLGNIVTKLPCSVRAGRFLVRVCQALPSETWYFASLIAAWIDLNGTIFYRPTRRPRESMESYNDRLSEIRSVQSEFYSKDCLETLLKAWILCSPACNEGRRALREWCTATGIYDRAIVDLDRSLTGIIKTMRGCGYNIRIPSVEALTRSLPDISKIKTTYSSLLKEVFAGWRFTANGYGDTLLPMSSSLARKTYVIDHNVPFMDLCSELVCFSLRDIGRKVIISNIVTFD
jgi:hypothetical protein